MQSEIITEINQIIIKLPENRLKSLLKYLRQLKSASNEQIETAELTNQIFLEDEALLKKLSE